jgi:hypothetical protein
MRVWSLQQAQAICANMRDDVQLDVDLAFDDAECAFLLFLDREIEPRDRVRQIVEKYRRVEQIENDRISSGHLEQREVIARAAIAFICACRILTLDRLHDPESDVRGAESDVRSCLDRLRGALGDLRDHDVTLDSPFQRRPVTQEVFREEVRVMNQFMVGLNAGPGRPEPPAVPISGPGFGSELG